MFDKHGFCVGLSGGYVATGGANTKPVTVTAAYRINQYARMGVFVGQDLNSKLPSNFGLSSKNPFVGAFAAVQQNVNGKGWNARASFGYHANDLSLTRTVFGTSEPGSGSASLVSKSVQGEVWYGFAVNPTTIVSPYAGIRYTNISLGGYTEVASDAVTAPLTYSKLTQEQTTALAGVKGTSALTSKVALNWSAGAEYDLAFNGGTFNATGVDGLTSFDFNAATNKLRPSASAGITYAPAHNHRLGVNLIYRRDAFSAKDTYASLANYAVGF